VYGDSQKTPVRAKSACYSGKQDGKEMAEKQSRLKGTPEPFTLRWQPTDTLHTLVDGEGHLLEMISSGAPLETILKELCSSLDGQIGKVTSLFSIPEEDEETHPTAAPSASHFGFSVFYCTEIVSLSGYLLATFEMYCCIPRTPTSGEVGLIERAMRIAARAIERDNPDEEFAGSQPEVTAETENFYKLTWSKN
jgi:hypothetical protein